MSEIDKSKDEYTACMEALEYKINRLPDVMALLDVALDYANGIADDAPASARLTAYRAFEASRDHLQYIHDDLEKILDDLKSCGKAV